jgi:hypothetical protein
MEKREGTGEEEITSSGLHGAFAIRPQKGADGIEAEKESTKKV